MDVRASGTGTATGHAGSGIIFRPNFSGLLRINADVQLQRTSFDLITAISLPFLPGSDVAGSTIDSDLFVRTMSGNDAPITKLANFRSASLTGFPYYAVRSYVPPPTFSIEFVTATVAGQPIRICAGVQSTATSLGLYPTLVSSKGLYNANLLRISLTRP